MSRRRPQLVVLALLALAALALPAPASAADGTGIVIAREHRVSGGQLDLRVLLTSDTRRTLRTSVPAGIVRVRPSQLRNLTGTFRTNVSFLRLGDRIELVGLRRSGQRLRVRQARLRANASLPNFRQVDRADTQEIRTLLKGQQAADEARRANRPEDTIRALIELGSFYNGVATTNVERADRQQLRIDQARAQLPTGGRRAAAGGALDRILARPANEVALRRGVAKRLRALVPPLDAEILAVGTGSNSTGSSPLPNVNTINEILAVLDPVLPAVTDLLNAAAGTGSQVGQLVP